MVLDTSLLNNQQYKVRIKGTVEPFRVRIGAPLHLGVVAKEKGAFGSLSTKVAIFTAGLNSNIIGTLGSWIANSLSLSLSLSLCSKYQLLIRIFYVIVFRGVSFRYITCTIYHSLFIGLFCLRQFRILVRQWGK